MPRPRYDDVALVVLVTGLLVIFAALALVVAATHGPLEIDRQIVALIAPWRGSQFDLPMKLATYLCSWQVIVAGTAVLVIALALRRHRRAAVLVLVAVAGDQIIVSALKAIIQRPRPDQALAILPAAGSSFPSGHTLICVVFYGLLAALVVRGVASLAPKVMIALAVAFWTLIVATSRIYLGAHWPTDVFGSMLLGSAWIILLMMIEARLSGVPKIVRLKAD